jgi:hypothetical protein
VPVEPHRDELVVDHIGTDLAVRALDELFDLRPVRIDDRRPLQRVGGSPAARRCT